MKIQEFKNWKSLNEQSEISLSTNKKEDIIKIQKKLIDLGYSLPEYGVDGKYGQETKAAVTDLQSDLIEKGYNLSKYGADGYWGSETEIAIAQFNKENPNAKLKDEKKEAPKEKTVTLEGGIKHKYKGNAAANIDKIIKSAKEVGITNPNAIIGVLSIVGKESGFIPRGEVSYSNTSNDRIRKILASANKYSDSELSELKKDTDKFWEAMYGKDTKVGKKLGNTKEGDGAKFKGRGFNQITGRANYKRIGSMIGEDLINNPEILNNVDIAAKALFAFIKDGLSRRDIDINKIDNPDDAIKKIARINAGWGNDYESKVVKYAISKANEIKPNFEIA